MSSEAAAREGTSPPPNAFYPSLPKDPGPYLLLALLVSLNVVAWLPPTRTLPLLANVWGVVLLVGVPDYAKAIGLVGLTIHWVEMVVAWYALATLQEKGLIKGRAVFMHLVAALAFGYPGLAGALRARHDIQVAAGLEPVPLLSFLPGYIIRRKQEEGPTKKPAKKASNAAPPKGLAGKYKRR